MLPSVSVSTVHTVEQKEVKDYVDGRLILGMLRMTLKELEGCDMRMIDTTVVEAKC